MGLVALVSGAATPRGIGTASARGRNKGKNNG